MVAIRYVPMKMILFETSTINLGWHPTVFFNIRGVCKTHKHFYRIGVRKTYQSFKIFGRVVLFSTFFYFPPKCLYMGTENHALHRVFFPVSAIELKNTWTNTWTNANNAQLDGLVEEYLTAILRIRVRFPAPANNFLIGYLCWKHLILKIRKTGYNVYQIRI